MIGKAPSPAFCIGRGLALGIVLLGISACADDDDSATTAKSAAAAANAAAKARGRTTMVDPYLEAVVIGPSPRFDPARLPESWYIPSVGGAAKISVTDKDGVVALRFEADREGAVLGRKLQVPLLTMPYLRWGWYVEPQAAIKRSAVQSGEPDVLLRVVVGFKTGPQSSQTNPNDQPKIDRALSLEWRASQAPAASGEGSVPMRTGTGDAGRWIIEDVDLSRLYAAAWPQDPLNEARIVFIAAGAGPTEPPEIGYIAEVVLSP